MGAFMGELFMPDFIAARVGSRMQESSAELDRAASRLPEAVAGEPTDWPCDTS